MDFAFFILFPFFHKLTTVQLTHSNCSKQFNLVLLAESFCMQLKILWDFHMHKIYIKLFYRLVCTEAKYFHLPYL
jgi:hypothetical protein